MYLSLNHMVEERTFLYSICFKTLRLDKSIKFASVINGEGKLIVGKSKQCIIKKNINQDYNFFNWLELLLFIIHNTIFMS